MWYSTARKLGIPIPLNMASRDGRIEMIVEASKYRRVVLEIYNRIMRQSLQYI